MTSVFETRGFPQDPREYIRDMKELKRATVLLWKWLKKHGIRKRPLHPAFEAEDQVEILILHEFYQQYFEEIRKIGKGDFGRVYEVQKKRSPSKSAVKRVLADAANLQDINKAKEEALHLADLSHVNIVKYHYSWIQLAEPIIVPVLRLQEPRESDCSAGEDYTEDFLAFPKDSSAAILHIEMELCKTDLQTWLKARNETLQECKQLPPQTAHEALEVFRQLMEAMKYVHSEGTVHGDIKNNNIFFGFDGKPKLGDFGLPSLKKMGLPGLFCPQEDIYDMGLVFIDLMIPFHTEKRRREEVTKIDSGVGSPVLRSFPKDMRDLISAMRNGVAQERPTAEEILNNPLFSKMEEHTERAPLEEVTADIGILSIESEEMRVSRDAESSAVNTGAIPKRTTRKYR